MDELPPDLPATYERVLDRAHATNEENRLIVQKALRWILWAARPLNPDELSEAVSFHVDDTSLDREAIVDPVSVLNLCGSLIRKTPGSETLELAHYTVKEFLEQIDPIACPKYMYVM